MKDGTVKLGDFGIARILEKIWMTITASGDLSYISPELCFEAKSNLFG
jgi:serine/threonine protein kinase